MKTPPPPGLGLTILLGLAACSSDPAANPTPDTDPPMSKTISIRVAGFIETAGIT